MGKKMTTKSMRLFLLTALCTGISHATYAQCTGPASIEGGVDYDVTLDTLEVCDGTDWLPLLKGTDLLWADNTTHISRGPTFHIINLGETTTTAGLDIASFGGFFAANKSALRGGSFFSGTHLEDVNIGLNSFAWGTNIRASGQSSFAAGSGNDAAGSDSIALGINANAIGSSSKAIGNSIDATGSFSSAFGTDLLSSGFLPLLLERTPL